MPMLNKIIWEGKGKWKNEVFPHRFEFDTKPLINLRNIPVNRLAGTKGLKRFDRYLDKD